MNTDKKIDVSQTTRNKIAFRAQKSGIIVSCILAPCFFWNLILFPPAGDNIVEIGANWIHGPSEENPVFRLARKYRLLDPEALSPENQAMDVGGHPPYVPNIFCSSGQVYFLYVAHHHKCCINLHVTICTGISNLVVFY